MKRLITLAASSAVFVAMALILTAGAGAHEGHDHTPQPTAGTKIAAELGFVLGTAIGPDNALYVADGSKGEVWRIDPDTGAKTLEAWGLPAGEEGGVSDIAFIGFDLYALTSGVSAPDVVGVYRIPKGGKPEILADLGAYALAHPVGFGDAAPTGNPYSLEVLDAGNLLVADANHNRLLVVDTFQGTISQLAQFDNIVPTGASRADNVLYVSQIGAYPHAPEDGRVWALTLPEGEASLVAAGVPFIIDVEKGPSSRLYALSFGTQPTEPEGPPADPFSGKVLLVREDGTFGTLVANLTMPTTLEIVGDTAFVTTMSGDVWRIDNISSLN
ncbi:MAG: ScyD/ScyE family protein [Dehalococcoidia bacterium]